MGKLSVIWRYSEIKIQKSNCILSSVIHITLPFGWLQKCSLFGSEVLNPETNDKRAEGRNKLSCCSAFQVCQGSQFFWNSTKIYLPVQKLSSPYLQDNLLVCHRTSHKPTIQHNYSPGPLDIANVRWKLTYRALMRTKAAGCCKNWDPLQTFLHHLPHLTGGTERTASSRYLRIFTCLLKWAKLENSDLWQTPKLPALWTEASFIYFLMLHCDVRNSQPQH